MILLALLLSSTATPTAASDASLVVKVNNRDAAADALAAKADALGGYFSSRNDASIVLRVPSGSEDEMIALAEKQGVLIQRTIAKQDLGEALEDARAKLRSREETLKRYFDVLKEAGPGQVVMVEREIIQQIQGIEHLKGMIRAMEHRLRYAMLNISFEFRERRAPLKTGQSSFGWINSVNLADLLEDFRR